MRRVRDAACDFWFIRLKRAEWGDGFSEASLRCPMVAFGTPLRRQFERREKRRQALLGSNLPREISVSDAPMACLALVGASRQGPLFLLIGHRSDASENPRCLLRRALESDEPELIGRNAVLGVEHRHSRDQ